MNDLITWLRAQIDTDERVAHRVEPHQAPNEVRAMVTREDSRPFLVIDSARVLAEVDAKRRILDQHEAMRAGVEAAEGTILAGAARVRLGAYAFAVKCLALPYADREGYREEWRP